ncbi:MAG: ATP-binding protein, partial [Pseudomonadales bacterium]
MDVIIDACDRCLTAQAAATEAISETIYVGFSGGLDSTVLLHALRTLAPAGVVALHVNHGIAAESDDWQAHCERICEDWEIPLRCSRLALDVGSNVEGVARAERYEFFTEALATGGFS